MKSFTKKLTIIVGEKLMTKFTNVCEKG